MATPKFQQRHYNDLAAVLRDVNGMEHADSHTVAMIAFQLERLFTSDNPNFQPARWIGAIFPEGDHGR